MADPWLQLFDRTSGILEDVQIRVNERNKAARSGAAGARAQSDSLQKSISQASINIDSLASQLRSLQISQGSGRSLGAGELHRREDMLRRLTTRRDELDHLAKFSPSTASESERAMLLNQGGGGGGGQPGLLDKLNLFGASETDETRGVGTTELVGAQRQRMDRNLSDRLDVLGNSIGQSGEAARAINNELDLQLDLIDDLHSGVTSATIAVSRTTGKVMSFSEKATAGGLMISVVVLLIVDILIFILYILK